MISREKIDYPRRFVYARHRRRILARAIRELPTPRPLHHSHERSVAGVAERSTRAAEELAADVVLRKPVTRRPFPRSDRSLGEAAADRATTAQSDYVSLRITV